MKLVSIHDVERPDGQGIFAGPLLEGDQANVRLIRLARGQSLPPHKHGSSDLMLYAAEGAGELELPEGPWSSTPARWPSIAVTRSCALVIQVLGI